MSDLTKCARLGLNITPRQLERIKAARDIAQEERGERISISTFVLEMAWPGIDAVLGRSAQAAVRG